MRYVYPFILATALFGCEVAGSDLFGDDAGTGHGGAGGKPGACSSATSGCPAQASSGVGGAATSSSSSGIGGAAQSSSVAATSGSGGSPHVSSSVSASAASSSQSASSSGPGGPYYPVGVQQDVPPGWLADWSICYQDTYDVFLYSKMPQIAASCKGPNIMFACKKTSSANYQVLAAAPIADVFFDTGSFNGQTHVANGVQWYHAEPWAWGFAPVGAQVWQQACDINPGSDRLCWHTIQGDGGWRCGDATGLNADASWQRVIFQK